jgi:hypothetical protein
MCRPSRWVLITVCDSNYAEHFGTSRCLQFRVMESRINKQFRSLLTSYDLVEVVFAWISFPYPNKLCTFNVAVPYMQRYVIYIVLLPHV